MSATQTNDDEINGVDGSRVLKIGYLRKLKTMKKKFFVLRSESTTNPACLEYYENEKKWKSGTPPKRIIVLKTCFNINRKLDVKQKHALALYTKDDCFTMILDSEEELESWLSSLLALQQGDEDVASDQPPKPAFEHVWQVNVRNKGLASSKNILGAYHLCLTSQTLSLVKLNTSTPQQIEFPLMSIRRCGHSYCFFFMELGRSAVTGSGELWMQTEDIVIAQNMHETILNAMRSGSREEITPRQRSRSSSTNESSKPINVHQRRVATVLPPVSLATSPTKRERADSVPSRPRTISDGPLNGSRKGQPWSFEIQRPHSMYTQPSSYSPPDSGGGVGEGEGEEEGEGEGGDGSSASVDNQFDVGSYKHWLSSPENSRVQRSSITEENAGFDNYLPMTPTDSELKRVLSLRRTHYVSMAPVGSNKSGGDDAYLDMSSGSTPVKSGTPAEDIRFSEFPLDKVRSYFTATEIEDEKLVRAYSVGSKPQHASRQNAATTGDAESAAACSSFSSSSRVRAFSVGSKVGLQFAATRGNASANGDKNKKSFSAPLLSNSPAKIANEDLMELDFAKSGGRASSGDSQSKIAFRSRSSKSTARAGKSDLLQVIGEISNPLSAVENNYSETSACQQQQQGEYMNIDLEKIRADRNKCRTNPLEAHEYANLQAGRLIPSKNKDALRPRPRPQPQSQSQYLDKSSSPYENVSYGPVSSCVTSDKELNYASLDLGAVAVAVAAVAAVDVGEDTATTPPHSPLSIHEKERLSYARIDFAKSEGLRNTSHTIRKIRQETT
uniref:Insulin receptor substrate 1 n=1 Tax=Strigamia maritima TaxID=126957 RepID=T1JCY1_STRMM